MLMLPQTSNYLFWIPIIACNVERPNACTRTLEASSPAYFLAVYAAAPRYHMYAPIYLPLHPKHMLFAAVPFDSPLSKSPNQNPNKYYISMDRTSYTYTHRPKLYHSHFISFCFLPVYHSSDHPTHFLIPRTPGSSTSFFPLILIFIILYPLDRKSVV